MSQSKSTVRFHFIVSNLLYAATHDYDLPHVFCYMHYTPTVLKHIYVNDSE